MIQFIKGEGTVLDFKCTLIILHFWTILLRKLGFVFELVIEVAERRFYFKLILSRYGEGKYVVIVGTESALTSTSGVSEVTNETGEL